MPGKKRAYHSKSKPSARLYLATVIHDKRAIHSIRENFNPLWRNMVLANDPLLEVFRYRQQMRRVSKYPTLDPDGKPPRLQWSRPADRCRVINLQDDWKFSIARHPCCGPSEHSIAFINRERAIAIQFATKVPK